MSELTGLYGAPLEGCATLLSRCASYQALIGTKSEKAARASIYLVFAPSEEIPETRAGIRFPDDNVNTLTDNQITTKIELVIEKRYDDPMSRSNFVEFSNLAGEIARELFASTDQYLEISAKPCGADVTVTDDKLLLQNFVISGSFA